MASLHSAASTPQGSVKQVLTEENYTYTVLTFRDRQAGVSEVYDPDTDTFAYNAYCLERVLMKELFTCEYEFLSDALDSINEEFGTWAPQAFEEKKGCGSCVAK